MRKSEKEMEREKIEIDDDLTTEEAIFLIEWGFDPRGSKKEQAKMES